MYDIPHNAAIPDDKIPTEIKKKLGLNEKNSLKKKKTVTSMARSILSSIYPNPEPNFMLLNMDESVIKTIISKLRILFTLME